MPNKDGIISLGFEYKKELEEACAIIEKELNNIGGDINLSDGIKSQIKELKSALGELKKDFLNSFEKFGQTKLDTKTFNSFEKKINKQLSSINSEIDNLKSQFNSIDNSVGLDKISEEFNNLELSVEKATKKISDFKKQTTANTKQSSLINTNSTIKGLEELKKVLSQVSKEDFDFGYTSKSADHLTKSLDNLIDKYYKIESEIDEISSSMQSIDRGTQVYKEQEVQLSKMRLELGKCVLEMDDILGATNSEKINWSKTFLNENDLINLVDNTLQNLKKFKTDAKKIIDSIDISIDKESITNSNIKNTKYDLLKGQINIPVGISTKQSTINKQLDEMINTLQERAAKSPIIAPVKLRVDSEYNKSGKKANTPSITQNQINEARKSTENVIPGLEKAFNNSMKVATNKAVENAKDSINSVREYFEKNPIAVYLTIPDSEKEKFKNLTFNDIKIDASSKKGQSLNELITNISSSIKDFSELKSVLSSIQDNKNNDIFQKMALSLDKVISKFDELIVLAKDLGNSFTGVFNNYAINVIDKQWSSISEKFKSIADESGKIDLNKQKKDIEELISMYYKYENMGGTNSLITVTDNIETLRKLDSVYKRLGQVNAIDNSENIKNEASSFEEVEKSVKSLTTAIGDTKVQAIKVEADTMEETSKREILAIKNIFNILDSLINRLNDIKGIELPEFHTENIDKIQELFNNSSQLKETFQGDNNLINSSDIVSYSSVLNQLLNSLKEINTLTNIPEIFKGIKIDEKQSDNILKLQESFEAINESFKKIDSNASTSNFLNQITELTKQADALKDLASILKVNQSKVKKTTSSVAQNPQIKFIDDIIEKFQPKLDTYSSRKNQSDDYKTKIDAINKSLDELRQKKVLLEQSPHITTEEEINEVKDLQKNIQDNIDAIKKMSSAEKGSSQLSIGKIIDKITKYLDKNTKISKEAKLQLKQYLDLLETGNPSVNLEKIYAEFLNITKAEREAHREGQSFWDIFKNKTLYNRAAQIASYYLSFTDFVRYGGQVIQNIRDVDTALTELRKVSDTTEQRLAQSFKNSAETAKELGSSVSDVITATADWSRMGYNIVDSEELARVSVLYKNVGDGIDIDDANSSLISTLQGFQLEANEAEAIIDKFNEVSNNFAIDSAGIGEALQRSAASFNAANTDLSKSIALITATNEVVQDPDSIGTLWKTMSARIRGADTELQQLGEETDEYTKTTSKLRDLVKSLTGFDIMLDEDTFKDIYEIILGIGKEWNNLTDVEQASLGEALAGKRNANALYAVLGNLDTLQEAYETAENSAGSAMREQENYEKSIQYSLDRLNASVQEWSNTLVSSGTIKWFVDFGTNAVKVLDYVTDKVGILIPLLGGLGAVLGRDKSKQRFCPVWM